MRKYSSNIAVLKKQVADHAYITPIAQHRNPDGTMNTAQFKIKWEKNMAEFEKMPLWDIGCTPGYSAELDPLQPEPYLVFVPAETEDVQGTIIVAHGGGFSIRTGFEGPNAALAFHDLGWNTAILTYRLQPYDRFDCLHDMQRAVRLLRSRREELGISDQIAVMGFSAGGMLSGNCATIYDAGDPEAEDPIERFSCRPDACVMSYGAFTGVSIPRPFMMPEPGNLNGRNLKEKFAFAVEKHVTPDTPPFFVWQTLSDDGRLGLILAKALSDAEVPYELHIFDDGVHGIGIGDGENDLGMKAPHTAHWVELADEFLVKYKVK